MELIHYDELTWPEVAELPRRTPLVVPLGPPPRELGSMAERLRSKTVVLLPPLPYGFPRSDDGLLSQLALPPGLLRRVLMAIQRSLREQGFERVLFLSDRKVARFLASPGLRFLGFSYTPRPQPPPAPRLNDRVVVVSLGHTEQHGYHLPLGTDTIIIQALADGLATAIPDEVACLPTWPYGVSTHTREFPGTLNLGGRLFEDVFLALVGRLVQRGATMIYFSNGHGGNHSFLVNVVKWAGERWPQAFVATEWLHTTGPVLDQIRESAQGGMGHACELETSYLLHLRPDLVRMDRASRETDFISTPNFYMDWIEGGSLIANPPWSDDTRSGIYGDPTLATAEKGRRWLEAAIQERVESIREVREQFQRRLARRLACGGRGRSSAAK